MYLAYLHLGNKPQSCFSWCSVIACYSFAWYCSIDLACFDLNIKYGCNWIVFKLEVQQTASHAWEKQRSWVLTSGDIHVQGGYSANMLNTCQSKASSLKTGNNFQTLLQAILKPEKPRPTRGRPLGPPNEANHHRGFRHFLHNDK